MAESPDQDRSEPATPFKLEEARKRGQVFRSMELNSLAVLTAAFLAMLAFSEWALARTMALCVRLLGEVGQGELSIGYVHRLLYWLGTEFLFLISPLLFLVAAVGVLANLLQTGPVFSFFPLKPDWTRLNPVTGLKKLFSMRALYEGGKSILKLGVLVLIVYLVLRDARAQLLGLLYEPLRSYPAAFVDFAGFALFALLLGFFCVSVVDFSYSRWEFHKRMRMSRRELRDEVKRREGDPQVRSKRRELQRAMRKKARAIQNVKDADVLITNPTHLAVALTYKRGQMVAPRVVAKGAGDIAARMRRAAFRYGVAVIENPPLARQLYKAADIDELIPESSYAAVAQILRKLAPAAPRPEAAP